jgi:hypothetical protein
MRRIRNRKISELPEDELLEAAWQEQGGSEDAPENKTDALGSEKVANEKANQELSV